MNSNKMKPLKVAIIGSGYAGLACGFYLKEELSRAMYARLPVTGQYNTLSMKIFGLEEYPGQQTITASRSATTTSTQTRTTPATAATTPSSSSTTTTSASVVSAGLLHPVSPRGKIMYKGEERYSTTTINTLYYNYYSSRSEV